MKRNKLSWAEKILTLALALSATFLRMPAEGHAAEISAEPAYVEMEDGEYAIPVELQGGSGKSTVTSPAGLVVKDGQAYARIEWSSSNYDYMIVGEEKYLPVNTEGYSTFEIPIMVFNEPMPVLADTTAMSTPHEIEYTLTFHGDEIMDKGPTPQEAAKRVVCMVILIVLVCTAVFGLTACGSGQEQAVMTRYTDISPELVYDHSMELTYAEEFAADYYESGHVLLSISDGSRYLIVPEGTEVPGELDEDVVVLRQPLENMYLVASAAMDMFVALDSLDSLRFSGTKSDGWYIDEARQAMETGAILYAGKYSAPDYEQILSEHCSLAIENTMIYHTPEVKEQLEKFGIPVMVDYSSYESNPLGRTEWIKLYGLLTGKEEEAEQVFNCQAEAFEAVSQAEKTDKTVVFFYITTNGEVNVRKSSDYLPKMIELAGGKYIFQNLGDESSASSTVSMQMEEFYAKAKDADYMIYNSTIDGELSSADDLLGKSSLLENMKAVQEGNVFCTSKNLYQSSMELGTIISDIHRILNGDTDSLTYIYKLE